MYPDEPVVDQRDLEELVLCGHFLVCKLQELVHVRLDGPWCGRDVGRSSDPDGDCSIAARVLVTFTFESLHGELVEFTDQPMSQGQPSTGCQLVHVVSCLLQLQNLSHGVCCWLSRGRGPPGFGHDIRHRGPVPFDACRHDARETLEQPAQLQAKRVIKVLSTKIHAHPLQGEQIRHERTREIDLGEDHGLHVSKFIRGSDRFEHRSLCPLETRGKEAIPTCKFLTSTSMGT